MLPRFPQRRRADIESAPTKQQKSPAMQSFLYIEIYLNFGELQSNSRRAASVVRTVRYAAQLISLSFSNTV